MLEKLYIIKKEETVCIDFEKNNLTELINKLRKEKELKRRKEYYKNNKERLKAYYEEHRERRKEYYEKNKEKIYEVAIKFRRANPDKIKKYNQTYREKDPEKYIEKRNEIAKRHYERTKNICVFCQVCKKNVNKKYFPNHCKGKKHKFALLKVLIAIIIYRTGIIPYTNT